MTHTLVNLEKSSINFILAPRAKRLVIGRGMCVAVMIEIVGRRPEIVWLRVTSDLLSGGEHYVGEVAWDTSAHLDLDRGHEVCFGPEHIVQWSVACP